MQWLMPQAQNFGMLHFDREAYRLELTELTTVFTSLHCFPPMKSPQNRTILRRATAVGSGGAGTSGAGRKPLGAPERNAATRSRRAKARFNWI